MENLTNNSDVQGTQTETKNVVVAPNAKAKRIAKKNAKKESAEKENSALLAKITAIGITENLKAKSETKKIFKSEFNNKQDRTKCRNKFISSLSLFLLSVAHNKKESAEKHLAEIKEVCNKYYVAESAFESKNQYCTENMQENHKSAIQLFIDLQKETKK